MGPYLKLLLMLVGCSVFFYFLGFLIGKRRQRREIIRTFDEILHRIYSFVVNNKWDELNIFIHDVCGRQVAKNKIDHEKRENGTEV